MLRQLVHSGAPWESSVGYSRAVRVGPHVFVSGTAALDERGDVVAPHDAYKQTKHILAIIKSALEEADARLCDVVRTRIFVTDITAQAEAVGRAHGEVFGSTQPACTMVEVARLIDARLLVEIEAQAFVT